MAVEIKVPQIGESITEVTIGDWLIKEGEAIEADKSIAVLESDKATMELPAQAAGTLTRILKKTGETAQVGEVIGIIDPDVAGVRPAQPLPNAPEAQSKAPKAEPAKASPPGPEPRSRAARETPVASPAPATPPPSTPSAPAAPAKRSVTPQAPPPPAKPAAAPPEFAAAPMEFAAADGAEEEEVVPMTRLRRTIAKRLVDAQRNAALLTTFNEVDMSAVMDLRKQYGEAFLEKYQTKLGFMSFFVKAAIDALKLVPQVNAEIRGDDIVYKNHYDIAIAIGGGKGLVVPVLRNADRLSFAEVELAIADFAKRARANALRPDELQGGTFTITNGGIYGSLLSTPLVNPPQSGILGMHSIQDRPVARAGQVVIRPMMYIALTYDHRLVDGREAVTFLKRIKEGIEEPTRMLLEI